MKKIRQQGQGEVVKRGRDEKLVSRKLSQLTHVPKCLTQLNVKSYFTDSILTQLNALIFLSDSTLTQLNSSTFYPTRLKSDSFESELSQISDSTHESSTTL